MTGTRLVTEQGQLAMEAFAHHFVTNGGNATQAAIAAGYSPQSARKQGYTLKSNPRVLAMIRKAQTEFLKGDLATQAITVLKQIMNDENAPHGARVESAKTILDRAGVTAEAAKTTGLNKPVQEMSVEELDAFITAGTAKLKQLESDAGIVDAEFTESEAD